MRMAVLLTTFNRRDKTINCLESIKKQKLLNNIRLEIFLTDDASKDGTADAVHATYPGIKVYQGNGSLYWAGGMRKSWKEALVYEFDYYLLLNDDTILNEKTINRLVQYAEESKIKTGNLAICVGSTLNEGTGEVSYGGRKLYSKRSIRSYKVYSDTQALECDLGNANIMLVPKEVVQKIGILSEAVYGETAVR